MRLALGLAAAISLGATAHAQTYQCRPGVLTGMDCKLSPADQAQAEADRGAAQLDRFMADMPAPNIKAPTARAPAVDSDRMTIVKMEAGALIAEGKCAEATDLAAKEGDLSLVRAVHAVCR